jgi:tRNA(Ile)-lysidine synthase
VPNAASEPDVARFREHCIALIGAEAAEKAQLGVAVSGGPDSMALLWLAVQAFPGRVRAATVDHKLRPEARAEAEMVARWCADNHVPHDILTPLEPIRGSIQSAARAARYALLESRRTEHGIDWIMTAHHADDQLETLLMRMNRSSGVGGLAGVRAVNGYVMRPLLGWRRAELARIADEQGLPHVHDPSNDDTRFDRVEMRQNLAQADWLDPLAAARSAAACADAEDALAWMVEEIAARHITQDGAMGFGKSKAKLLTDRSMAASPSKTSPASTKPRKSLQEIVEFLRDPGKFQRLGGKIPRRAARRPARHRQDAARARHRGRSQRAVLHHLGLGLRRNVRRRRRQPRARHVRAGQEERALHHLHRRNRRGRPPSRRRPRRRQRRARADAEPAAGRDGRLRGQRRHHPDRRDQPSRRARPALLRPGRFDRQVVVPNPDVAGREKILRVHMRKVPLAPDVDLKVIARGTPGFSGADLANLVNEAALLAARRGKRVVTMAEFEDAKDKVMMGAERRSMVMTEDEKKLTAYHEAGHAIVALNVPASDPVHKATIIPRGRALGMVMQPAGARQAIPISRDKMTSRTSPSHDGRPRRRGTDLRL